MKPINHLDLHDPERVRARKDGIVPLARRIKPFAPKVVVIVMKAIVSEATAALVRAGHANLPREELPFPARHRDRYVAELADLVRRLRRHGVFDAGVAYPYERRRPAVRAMR